MAESEVKQIYYNEPQLKAKLLDANEEYHVLGRGTGKSSGILAPRALRNALQLPRTLGLCVVRTYQQGLTQTLPSLMKGWSMLGLKRDLHYTIGKKFPKAWNIPEPFEPPLDHKYVISFCNGTAMQLVSQDRPGSSNGINSDWILADEAKYMSYQKYLDETLPTMRANRDVKHKNGLLYKDIPSHWSICMTTSMPTAADAQWILKKREEMDKEKVEVMFAIIAEVMALESQLPKATPYKKAQLQRAINGYNERLRVMRKDTLFYQEASTFANIAILGEDYIKRMKRIMPDFIFNTEILNMRPDSVEGGFYPLLDILRTHGYTDSFDNDLLEKLDYNFEKISELNCKQDSDCITTMPLRFAPDWGGRMSSCTITQHLQGLYTLVDNGNELRFLNEFYVKHPKLIDDLIDDFSAYYKPHKERLLYYLPDNEHGNNRMANSALTYNQSAIERLRKNGWRVVELDLGRIPSYQQRYLLWYKILSETDPRLPRARFNTNHCKYTLTSMKLAPLKQGTHGQIEKDKGSEKKLSVDSREATHLSDTADLQACAVDKSVINSSGGLSDIFGLMS